MLGDISGLENIYIVCGYGDITLSKMKRFVSEIFVEPEKWGLRGNPLFGEYLKNHYVDIEAPYPIEKFYSEIFLIFQDFSGSPLEKGERYFVSEHGGVHAGMSSGQLDGSFWVDTAILLLSNRLKKLNDECILLKKYNDLTEAQRQDIIDFNRTCICYKEPYHK